jgi:hypothetical protein
MIQSTNWYRISLKFLLILLFFFYASVSRNIFQLDFPTSILNDLLIDHLHAKCHAYRIPLHAITPITFKEHIASPRPRLFVRTCSCFEWINERRNVYSRYEYHDIRGDSTWARSDTRIVYSSNFRANFRDGTDTRGVGFCLLLGCQ